MPGKTLDYGFGATVGCGSGSGVLTNPGANSDRTSLTTTPNGGSPTTFRYCYGTGDQLLSSTDPSVGTIAYDSHGETTSIHGETHSYDATGAHTGTVKGTTNVSYVRDATGRIVERDVNGSVTDRYSFGGPTDASSAVLNSSNVLVAATVALPGGVMLTDQASGDVWSYTNVHGDVTATANSTGVKQGATVLSDPFGNNLSGTPADNQPGNMDDQWLGGPQRQTEHETGLTPIIEMGARQYDPTTGRFLTIDPVFGGSANQYDYTNQDPVNNFDLDGLKCWSCALHHLVSFGKATAKYLWSTARSLWNGKPGLWFRAMWVGFALAVALNSIGPACATISTGIGAAICAVVIFGAIQTALEYKRLVDKALGRD